MWDHREIECNGCHFGFDETPVECPHAYMGTGGEPDERTVECGDLVGIEQCPHYKVQCRDDAHEIMVKALQEALKIMQLPEDIHELEVLQMVKDICSELPADAAEIMEDQRRCGVNYGDDRARP